MPRFAANLSTLFTEVPLLERFERAARAGFSTVEMQFPYEAPAAVAVRHLPRAALRGRVGGDDKQDPGAHRPHPGRRQSGGNEPGTGEINDPFLFAHLDRIGYQGWIGCEYKPAASTEAGLGWLEQARSTLRATS